MAFTFATNPQAIAPGQRYREYDEDDTYKLYFNPPLIE